MKRRKRLNLLPEDVGFYTDVPISTPLVSPETELGQMNGFAWTDEGLRVALGTDGNFFVDELRKLRSDDDMATWWLRPGDEA